MHALELAEKANDLGGAGTWVDDLNAHVAGGGYLLASAGVVFLWRPVWSHWLEERLCNPWDCDPAGDAWYVWSAAGRGALPLLRAMAESAMFPRKEKIAFHRRGSPRFYTLESILYKIPWANQI